MLKRVGKPYSFFYFSAMATLTFTYKDRMITCPLTVKAKHMASPDYILTGKNGYSIFYFRKVDNVWKHVYGTLPDDMRDAIIQALSARFDKLQ